MIKLKKILVPTDFSDYSMHALQYGLSFCREFTAELILLHVIEDPFYPSNGATFGFNIEEFFRQMEEESSKRMLEMVPPEIEKEMPVERIAIRGTPFLEIIRLAKERAADMIVLSTHGRSGLAHVLMGSVTEKVVRKAPCPVLVVRRSQHEFIMP
ncbi:MAG TPA: universal stress protein [Planctomycetota bacterium]|nr:universal stress protein [Planctomycetota bacterium]